VEKYGFDDAFNPETGQVDLDVIGIDVGIALMDALVPDRVRQRFQQDPLDRTARTGIPEFAEATRRTLWARHPAV